MREIDLLISQFCYDQSAGGNIFHMRKALPCRLCPAPRSLRRYFSSSTATFRKHERLAAWREIFGRTVYNLDIDPLEPGTFSSEATGMPVAAIGCAVRLERRREFKPHSRFNCR